MHVIRRRGWELPESLATPEHVFFNRRQFISGAAGIAAASALPGAAAAQRIADIPDPTASLYPVARNAKYTVNGEITAEKVATTYNNFYEFGFSKDVVRPSQALPIRPWTVKFDGMVEKEMTVGIDDLIKAMPLEERVYRMRCVEAWSMVVPWAGFPMAKLVEYAKPLSSAKFVRMETFMNPTVAPLQRDFRYPWPYVEGCTIAEATNELAFMVTGIYGKVLPKQHGAPIRLMLPWKYGFKSLKSIVKFTFTDKRPVGYWEKTQAAEYGFWANVHPGVSHPRWSQADEEVLGTGGKRRKTDVFNGYGEYVAALYKGMEDEPLYK
jgi:sulfoxide reductase catalytic subunit YedY